MLLLTYKSWPEQVQDWLARERARLCRNSAANATHSIPRCSKCGSIYTEVRRYGTTGELGDVVCGWCGNYTRPWNAY